MLSKQEVKRWLDTLDATDHICVSDGGLQILAISEHGEPTGAYLELGGEPEVAVDNERLAAKYPLSTGNEEFGKEATEARRESLDYQMRSVINYPRRLLNTKFLVLDLAVERSRAIAAILTLSPSKEMGEKLTELGLGSFSEGDPSVWEWNRDLLTDETSISVSTILDLRHALQIEALTGNSSDDRDIIITTLRRSKPPKLMADQFVGMGLGKWVSSLPPASKMRWEWNSHEIISQGPLSFSTLRYIYLDMQKRLFQEETLLTSPEKEEVEKVSVPSGEFRGMAVADFKIGDHFRQHDGGPICRVTDVGSRTLAYITLDKGEDTSWYNGPPYPVAEKVLDEDGLEYIQKL